MNAKTYLKKYGDENLTSGVRLAAALVIFGDDPSNGNWLMLVEHYDGRIDLIDSNCGDTGSDLSNLTGQKLMDQATEWVDCVTRGEVLGEDEDTDELMEQLDTLAELLGVKRSITAWEAR